MVSPDRRGLQRMTMQMATSTSLHMMMRLKGSQSREGNGPIKYCAGRISKCIPSGYCLNTQELSTTIATRSDIVEMDRSSTSSTMIQTKAPSADGVWANFSVGRRALRRKQKLMVKAMDPASVQVWLRLMTTEPLTMTDLRAEGERGRLYDHSS